MTYFKNCLRDYGHATSFTKIILSRIYDKCRHWYIADASRTRRGGGGGVLTLVCKQYQERITSLANIDAQQGQIPTSDINQKVATSLKWNSDK